MVGTLGAGLLFVAVLGGAGAQTAGTLAGTAWNAVELYGAAVAGDAGPAQRRPHLVFGGGGRLSGSDGCNRLSGSYSADGDGITFGAVAATRMACPDSGDVPERFHAALKGTGRWRITDGRLHFYDAGGKPLAIFEPRAAGQAPPAAGE